MKRIMDWVYSILRVIGVNFKWTASIVQIHSEVKSREMDKKIKNLEDPIHSLGGEVSEILFRELYTQDSINLLFKNDFYTQYSRTLDTLVKKHHISIDHITSQNQKQINLIHYSFILSMAHNFEDKNKIRTLEKTLDTCPSKEILTPETLSDEIGISKHIVIAFFEDYAERNHGFLTRGFKKHYQCK